MPLKLYFFFFMIILFHSTILFAQETEPSVSPPTSLVESKLEKPIFPDKGVYIENGYAFGLLLLPDDRDAVKDSLWIDGRIGYQIHPNLGIHLEGGYFISSLRTNRRIDANYFRIGPGVKILFPFRGHWAGFMDTMLGYGRASASDPTSGTSISKNGFALGLDGGVTYKVAHWFGISPYIGLHSVLGKVGNDTAVSYWFVSGAMTSFIF